MNDMPMTPAAPRFPAGAGPVEPAPPRPTRRWLKLAVGVGAAAGVAVGATALAQAATSSGTPGHTNDATDLASGASTTTTTPARPHGFGGPGRLRGGFGLGGPGLGLGGGAIYGQFTIKGPNGYETISERTGTVSSVTDTSGSTWSLAVKSADGTSATFTVDSGTSVNGGEMGIGSVKTGDTVRVTAVVSGSTATAKSVTDQTTLKSNGGTWQPVRPQIGPNSGTGNSGTGNSGAGTTGTQFVPSPVPPV